MSGHGHIDPYNRKIALLISVLAARTFRDPRQERANRGSQSRSVTATAQTVKTMNASSVQ